MAAPCGLFVIASRRFSLRALFITKQKRPRERWKNELLSRDVGVNVLPCVNPFDRRENFANEVTTVVGVGHIGTPYQDVLVDGHPPSTPQREVIVGLDPGAAVFVVDNGNAFVGVKGERFTFLDLNHRLGRASDTFHCVEYWKESHIQQNVTKFASHRAPPFGIMREMQVNEAVIDVLRQQRKVFENCSLLPQTLWKSAYSLILILYHGDCIFVNSGKTLIFQGFSGFAGEV